MYIAESGSNIIRKLDSEENCIDYWGGYGIDEGKFAHLNSMAIDKSGYVYATDSISVQKFTSNGDFIIRWSNFGSGDGEFNQPEGVAVDKEGYVYVADLENYRIQKFNKDGRYEDQWGEYGAGDEQFGGLWGIATDAQNNVFVVDPGVCCIKKFTSGGEFLVKWGKYEYESEEGGKFTNPCAIAVDKNGNVFVTDVGSTTTGIQKFKPTPDGSGGIDNSGYEFDTMWGRYSSEPDPGPGEFRNPCGIAVDDEGNVYVTDRDNQRILKFKPTLDGTGGVDNSGYEIDNIWGGLGSGEEEFISPFAIALDAENNVYVTDSINPRVQKFDQEGNFITMWGETGSWAGQFEQPRGIAVNENGKVYVADKGNNRIQVFKKYEALIRPKAIIVAGREYSEDSLWDSTRMCTNFAYSTLIYQGFTKDDIYYLSADTKLDRNRDGEPDVRGEATIVNLRDAITKWAVDEEADSLVLYLADHGGEDKFRLNENETLSAAELSSWLNDDELQNQLSDKMLVVYDACESGSFIDDLIADDRIIITSTLPGERAKFLSQGTISFSSFFWTHIFNGLSIEESYLLAKQVINFAFDNQNPQLSGHAENIYIGNAAGQMIGGSPEIESVSPPQDIGEDENSATLYADGVTDLEGDGIARVWAVIWRPDLKLGATDIPLT
ncbi:MAG: caspase family protein, partial [Deltaproteobacteria bacterium]|nr:caspase family protein [Deltaproteobacteria bacterium]